MCFFLMMGNWTEHTYLNPEQPSTPYGSAINSVDTIHNTRTFVNGYHILHHMKMGLKWTKHVEYFYEVQGELAKNDCITLKQMTTWHIWIYTMTGRLDKIADQFVPLNEKQAQMTKQDIIDMLKERLKPIKPKA